MQEKNEKSYWPHAIVVILILGFIAGGWTIKIALDNPVHLANNYNKDYKYVDKHINKIIHENKKFDENYEVLFETKEISFNKKSDINFYIVDKKTNKKISNAEVNVVLSRPDSNDFNENFLLKTASNGNYNIKDIVVPKKGRWQVLLNIKIDKYKGYKKYEVQTQHHISLMGAFFALFKFLNSEFKTDPNAS